MNTIQKNINKFLSNDLKVEHLRKYLLQKDVYGEFYTPPRKIDKFIKENTNLLDSKITKELQAIIKTQLSHYKEIQSQFSSIRTEEDLYRALGFEKDEDFKNFLKLPRNNLYEKFLIPKKTGGFREINKPDAILRTIQKKISFILNIIYTPGISSHGFTWNRNVLTNASSHVNKGYVFNIDIKDFFPSFTEQIVYGIFNSFLPNASKSTINLLVQLCTHNNALPQGAPTSPIITNLYCSELDNKILILAKNKRCNYTRYADDISFSANHNMFDDTFLKELEAILSSYGFRINTDKTRLQTKSRRQEVTGIIVNEKPNISRKYIRNIRVFLHMLETRNFQEIIRKHKLYYNKFTHKGLGDPYAHIKGKIEFVGFVKGKSNPTYINFDKRFKIIINKKHDGYQNT